MSLNATLLKHLFKKTVRAEDIWKKKGVMKEGQDRIRKHFLWRKEQDVALKGIRTNNKHKI